MKTNKNSSVSHQAGNKTVNSSKSNPKKELPPVTGSLSSSKDNIQVPSVVEENKSTIPTKSLYSNGRQEKKKKEKSIEEEIMEKDISTLEKTRLNRAFEILCAKDLQIAETEYGVREKSKTDDEKIKDSKTKERQFFTSKDVMRVLEKLNYKLSKHEVDMMIWEVDENLDEFVDRYEFDLMYKRCIFDKTGLEPKQLFYLVEFLMYDKQERNKITVEDTLELLYVKTKNYGKSTWEDEIHSIFGPENKNNEDGKETEVTFKEFLESQIKKSISLLKQKETEKKLQKPFKKGEEDEMI